MKRMALLLLAATSACSVNLAPIGTWRAVAPPPVPLIEADVLVLADGRVLSLGGLELRTGQPLAQTFLFDPGTDRWSAKAAIPEPRSFDSVARLRNGDVLVAGGLGASPGSTRSRAAPAALATTWVYDPTADRWSQAADLLSPRESASAAVLSDGRVLLVGGSEPLAQPTRLPNGGVLTQQPVGTAEEYNPAAQRWQPAGRLSAVRNSFAFTALPGGGAMAAGGCNPSSGGPSLPALTPMATVDIFDPSTSRWHAGRPLPTPRCGGSAIPLADGRVLVLGGIGPAGVPDLQTDLFDPRTGRWASAGSLTSAAIAPDNVVGLVGSARLSDGRVLIVASQMQGLPGRVQNLVFGGQLFDPGSDSWSYVTSTGAAVGSQIAGYLAAPQVEALPNDRALIISAASAALFDPAGTPPPVSALDGFGLTIGLLAISVFLLTLLLALALLESRRRRAAI